MSELTIQQAFELALQHHQAGRLPEAEQIYRKILAQTPEHAGALHYLGVIAHQTGRHDIALELIRRALTLNPDMAEAYNNLGTVLGARGQLDDAIAAHRQSIALNPNMPQAYFNVANVLKAQDRLDDAIAAYHQAISLDPNYVDARSNLGSALVEKGQFDEAIALYRQTLDLRPDSPEGHYYLGNILKARGQLDDAIASYQKAIALNPNYADAHNNLGTTLMRKARIDDAIAAYRQTIALNQSHPQAYNNLGNALKDKGQLDNALIAYRQAIALNPGLAEAYNNLGAALTVKGDLDDADAACRKAIALNPNFSQAYSNLGNVLKDKCRLDEAIAAYRHAIALNPAYAEAHSNLLFTIQYHPGYEAQAIAEEHRQWNRRHGEPLGQFIQPHDNDRSLDRRLRIGYVSPDFWNHPVGRFLLPLLERHDRRQFEVFCYSDVTVPDEITARVRAAADHWRPIAGQPDSQVAECIRADRIDLLIDTTAHTAKNRMLLFARKPAPVQITWLFTTGLMTMDYRLTDAYLDPPGHGDELYCEQPLRLPNCFWCFEPPGNAPAVNALPALAKGYITFGSLNNFVKINSTVLRLWAEVLSAIADSRMILQCSAGDHQNQVRQIFESAGIASERVELVPRGGSIQKYFEQYHRVDICLDPTPFSGHTTSFDTLWMGVPLVTLAGRTVVGRSGVSILSNLGLTELIARTPEEYISIVVKLAGNLPKLAEMRAGMRQKMLASPLMDAAGYARDTEAAYRSVWHAWR